jgi:hypothetical protein
VRIRGEEDSEKKPFFWISSAIFDDNGEGSQERMNALIFQ